MYIEPVIFGKRSDMATMYMQAGAQDADETKH
jgi:hypothetical protein